MTIKQKTLVAIEIDSTADVFLLSLVACVPLSLVAFLVVCLSILASVTRARVFSGITPTYHWTRTRSPQSSAQQ